MKLEISFEHETETNRWIAELVGIPGLQPILAYGNTKEAAALRIKQLALQEIAWMIEDGTLTHIDEITFSSPSLTAA